MFNESVASTFKELKWFLYAVPHLRKSFAVNDSLKSTTQGHHQMLGFLSWDAPPGFYSNHIQLLLICGSLPSVLHLKTEEHALLVSERYPISLPWETFGLLLQLMCYNLQFESASIWKSGLQSNIDSFEIHSDGVHKKNYKRKKCPQTFAPFSPNCTTEQSIFTLHLKSSVVSLRVYMMFSRAWSFAESSPCTWRTCCQSERRDSHCHQVKSPSYSTNTRMTYT